VPLAHTVILNLRLKKHHQSQAGTYSKKVSMQSLVGAL